MNNKEKAQEIAENSKQYFYHDEYECGLACALRMAKWKDEQLNNAIDKALQRNGDFLKQGKITQYGFDLVFATIQNIREYLKLQQNE